jgi:hypothetical protein
MKFARSIAATVGDHVGEVDDVAGCEIGDGVGEACEHA